MEKTAKKEEADTALPTAAKTRKQTAKPRAKRKAAIYMFNPVIYPFKLWVAVQPKPQDVIGRFYGVSESNADELVAFSESEFHKDSSTDATTYNVRCDGKVGALVIIWFPKRFDVNGMSHEASHVTDLLCEYLGVTGFDFNGGEARAYFNGWVAECLDKAKRGKA